MQSCRPTVCTKQIRKKRFLEIHSHVGYTIVNSSLSLMRANERKRCTEKWGKRGTLRRKRGVGDAEKGNMKYWVEEKKKWVPREWCWEKEGGSQRWSEQWTERGKAACNGFVGKTSFQRRLQDNINSDSETGRQRRMCNNVTQVMGVHGWRCSVGSRVGGIGLRKCKLTT